jgi:predicted DCC family thiol-disulfide oxidoreductase YuxK
VLCSGFYRFMLKHDRRQRFAFATAQSPIGQQLYKALGLPTYDFETNLVIINGLVFQRLDASAAAMRSLGGIWHLPALLRFLPNGLKDFAYHRIARNRYRIFGRYDTCMAPSPAQRARFVKGGFQ